MSIPPIYNQLILAIKKDPETWKKISGYMKVQFNFEIFFHSKLISIYLLGLYKWWRACGCKFYQEMGTNFRKENVKWLWNN